MQMLNIDYNNYCKIVSRTDSMFGLLFYLLIDFAN